MGKSIAVSEFEAFLPDRYNTNMGIRLLCGVATLSIPREGPKTDSSSRDNYSFGDMFRQDLAHG
mgnify:CR=1 FL=1